MSVSGTPAGFDPLPQVADNPVDRGTGPHQFGSFRGSGPVPIYTFGGSPPTSASNPQALNNVATQADERQQQIAAENAPIRIPYGRVSMGAQIADVLFYNGSLVIIAVWGQGPMNSIEAVYLDEAAAPAGVTIVNYTGTQVAADATLVSAYAAQSPSIAYADVLPNIAYSVVTLPPNLTTGFPRISAIVQGLKVWDPRSSSTVYSDNPALVIADLQTNATYGAGALVDWTSVSTVANACDALVAGTEKRRTIGLVLDTPQDLDQWFEALRAYAGCFLSRTGGTLSMSVDRPTSSSFTFSEATNPSNCRIRNIKRRSKRDVPTVSAVKYTDTTTYPWRDVTVYAYAPGAIDGTVPWKIREVAMPGITRSTQALREAIEQLNKLTLNDLTFDIEGQDESLSVTVGDVVTATANLGVTARLMRVLNASTPSLGRPVFTCEGYDPAVYSDSVVAAPSVVDTSLPNPNQVPAPTLLVVNENVYLEQVNGSSLSGGLIYQSRFDCTWTGPTIGYPVTYRVEVWDGTTKIRDELVSNPSYSTPAVQQGKTYTINVFSRNSLGVECTTPLSTAKAALGKLLVPGPVPSITEARSLAGIVRLAWTAAIDIDVMRYEWRYTPNQTAGGSWAAATFIDRVDGLRTTFAGLPVGTHRFYVRAIDSVGQYSSSDCTADISITSDVNSFVQTHEFTSPTLTNMVEIPMLEGPWKRRWATRVATDAFTAVEPNAFNTGGNPVISYHASATSKWQGESWDLGQLTTGDWTLSAPEVNVTGAATFAIETSPDGSTWTSQPGISFSGSARFVRPVIQTLTTGTMVLTAPVTISLASLVKTETGLVTTLASGGKSVLLTGKYSGYQDLQATAVNTALARMCVADRILLHAQGGLQIAYTLPSGAYTSGIAQQISAAVRTVLADDYLEYDIYIDPSNPAASVNSDGGMQVIAGATNLAATNDADGYNATAPAAGFDALARGVWKSRKIAMAALAGNNTSQWRINAGSQGVGDAKVLWRNIRVTNGAGTDRLAIWSGGEPSTNTNINTGIQTNVRCGPSNAFLLYAFNDAGAQIAQDAQYSFKGY